MQSSFAPPSAMPAGARWLPSVRDVDVPTLGEEAGWLARLADAGVAIARGWLFPVGRAPLDASFAERIAGALLGLLAAGHARGLRVGVWFATRAAESRFSRDVAEPRLVEDAGSAMQMAEAFAGALIRSLGGREAGPGVLDGVWLRALAVDGRAEGLATSVGAEDGDPDVVSVWTRGARAWSVDRRAMRDSVPGDGDLDADRAARVADLADRAQLALGVPVKIAWVENRGALYVGAVRPYAVTPRFTRSAYRRVALMAEDEGTVAPLAVDAVDKALGRDDPSDDEPRVRRVYARPYRRIDHDRDAAVARGVRPGPAIDDTPSPPASPRGEPAAEGEAMGGDRADALAGSERRRFWDVLWSPGAGRLPRAVARVVRVAADAAAPLGAAQAFARQAAERIAERRRVRLEVLSDDALVDELRERRRLVVEALALLERARVATLAALPAIEALAGAVPREAYLALAALRPTRDRRRAHERLARLGETLVRAGRGPGLQPAALPPALRRQWDETIAMVATLRPLSLCVLPEAYGASDAHLERVVFAPASASPHGEDERREQERAAAERRLAVTARARRFGPVREAALRTVCLGLSRLADAKGEIADWHALALLSLREAALVAGARLAESGILEEPTDALYLEIDEIADALSGEPGAYAARVRLRREDDQRWRAFEAPRRLRPRRSLPTASARRSAAAVGPRGRLAAPGSRRYASAANPRSDAWQASTHSR